MAAGGSISFEGMNEVLAAMRKAGPRIQRAAMKGLQKGGLDVIADAKVNLRQNRSVVTGLLRASGKVQKVSDEVLEVGFFDTTNREGYAWFVEYGRRAGGMPPRQNLASWAYKKFRIDWSHAWAIATNMARRIAREGTHPHPYFGPALEKNKENITRRVQESINEMLNKNDFGL